MAAKIGQGKLGYPEKKSPGKEDVMQCLKNTRKGKLTYGSNIKGNAGAPTQHGRSVQIDGNRLVISFSSPPDQRNRESIVIQDEVAVNVPENSNPRARRIVKFHQKGQTKRNVSGIAESEQYDRNTTKLCERIRPRASCDGLSIYNHDVLDLVKDYRILLEEKARMEVRKMKQKFLSGLDKINDDMKLEEKYVDDILDAQYNSDVHELEETIIEAQSRYEKDMNKVILHHKKRQQVVSETLQEIAKKQQEIDLEKKRHEEARQKMITFSKGIETALNLIRTLSMDILKELDSHKTNVHLQNLMPLGEKVKSLYSDAAKISMNALTRQEKLEESLESIQTTSDDLELIKELVLKEITKAETKVKEEEERKEMERKAAEAKMLEAKKLEEEKRKEQEANTASVKQNVSVVSSSSERETLMQFVSPVAFEHYQEILQFREEVAQSLAQFKSSKDKKSMRFDLTKVINTSINAISDQSPQHLLDKIERLTKLLKGDTVELGDKKISVAGDTDGLAYCKDTVAKKLVLQGSKQISSNFNSAFAFGTVALGIWSQFPDVGKLMLAHFYLACPYLVPYYLPRKEGQSVAEYCKCLGYEVEGEDVESEDKYQKKLSGIVRLYAAILQSPMPPSLSSMPHPFGVHNGWTWISRVINLEVRETTTATILYDFLEVAGYSLSNSYGMQFTKLLQILCSKIVPKVDQITQPENKGSVVRLKIFLDKCVKSNNFPIPDGHISSRWWKNNGQSVSLF